MSEPHTCMESVTCACSLTALEPNEDCPIHGGGPWPPRCGECGRFIKHFVLLEEREAKARREELERSQGREP